MSSNDVGRSIKSEEVYLNADEPALEAKNLWQGISGFTIKIG